MDSDSRNEVARLDAAEVGGDWIRSARALLGWTAEETAAKCGVSRMSVVRFETGVDTVSARTVRDIVRGFEESGIVFVRAGDGVGMLRRAAD